LTHDLFVSRILKQSLNAFYVQTGKSKDEVSQLESQRLKYEADIQRRLKAQQAAQVLGIVSYFV
jgi:hypothetical protein